MNLLSLVIGIFLGAHITLCLVAALKPTRAMLDGYLDGATLRRGPWTKSD